MGWLYGRVLVELLYRSPPMKMYYFMRYQYFQRIKPFLNRRKNKEELY